MSRLPSLLAGLLDDAATFPPGNAPLARAVRAHLRHRSSPYSTLVGPLVTAVDDLAELSRCTSDIAAGALGIALTAPLERVRAGIAVACRIPAIWIASIEVTLPAAIAARQVVPELHATLGDTPRMTVYVEIPRDVRRHGVLDALRGTGYHAKFRTGGVRADLYPDEAELAQTLAAAVRAGVPFKATAGLHHAIRNTDPVTRFEQHGFLNLLAATGAACDGAQDAEVVAVLAERDALRVADRVRSLDEGVHGVFRSFGTCSIEEPVRELAALGLIDPSLARGLA